MWLGDYADRGRHVREVVDGLIAGRAAGRRWHCLMGNHDRFFRDFLARASLHDGTLKPGASWFSPGMGGLATLASYGVVPDAPPRLVFDDAGRPQLEAFVIDGVALDAEGLAARFVAAVPPAHRAFLDGLKLWHETEALFLVHAGVRPGVPLDAQDEEDLLWIRDPFLFDDTDHSKLVVHGHTVVEAPLHAGNRVGIDTGAGYGDPVTVAVFEGAEAFVVTAEGRVRLEPRDIWD